VGQVGSDMVSDIHSHRCHEHFLLQSMAGL
jgi:hypothetical protein